MGGFCMHPAFSGAIGSTRIKNMPPPPPSSIRNQLFHLAKSPFSWKNECLEGDVAPSLRAYPELAVS